LPSRWLLGIYGHVSRVTPNATVPANGVTPKAENELDELEELSDDAIVAHQQGAHVPKPRAQVTEESRSVVISDLAVAPVAANGSERLRSPERRSRGRTEKTVVIRSRRQIEDLRRAVAQYGNRATKGRNRGVLLWVVVGLAAFLAGGLAALFATPNKSTLPPPAPAPVASESPPRIALPAESAEPPSVSIDELPIEGSHKRKK
jgi:hypothetical protein